MFLKKDTITLCGESIVLHELSALQRVEYFEFLSAQEALLGEKPASPGEMAQVMRINVEVNAWLVSRSLWHTTPEREEEAVFREVLKTWSSDALNEAVSKVLALSDMVPKVEDEVDATNGSDDEQGAGRASLAK